MSLTRTSSAGLLPNLTILPEFGLRSATLPPDTSSTAASVTWGGFRKRITGYRKEISEAATPPPTSHDNSDRRLCSEFGDATAPPARASRDFSHPQQPWRPSWSMLLAPSGDRR